MASFAGKVVAITGGASGMGLATACILAKRGASISLVDLGSDRVDAAKSEVQKLMGHDAHCVGQVVDVTDSDAVDAWIEGIVKDFGKLDVAVNCAGIGSFDGALITEVTNEDWDRVQNVNLRAMFFCLRAQLRAMEKGASIVNIASTAGLHGFETQASYVASKFGVIGLTRTAAREFSPRGIRVNVVAPGVTETPLTQNAPQPVLDGVEKLKQTLPIRRTGQPEEVAELICFLASDAASYMTGAAYLADGGLMA